MDKFSIHKLDGWVFEMTTGYLDMSDISIHSASFDWWNKQKGIDPSRSSKNNVKDPYLKLDFLEDDDSDLPM